MMKLEEKVNEINKKLKLLNAEQRINWALDHFKSIITTTSGGKTSAIIPNLLKKTNIPIIFIDTGYHEESTHNMIQHFKNNGNKILTYNPLLEKEKIEKIYPHWQDPESEYFNTVSNIIKLEPLQRAFEEHEPNLWIRGIMHDQTKERRYSNILTYEKNLYRLHPIIDWTNEDSLRYIESHNLLINNMHYDPTKSPSQKKECPIQKIKIKKKP